MKPADLLPRPEWYPGRARGGWLSVRVGTMLGITFATCFVTGLISHFHQHPGPVGTDRLDAQGELAGNFLVAVTPGEHHQHLLFPVAQFHRAGFAFAAGHLRGERLAGQGCLKIDAALRHRADRLDQFVAGGAFEHVTDGAHLAHLAQVALVLVGCHCHHLDFRRFCL